MECVVLAPYWLRDKFLRLMGRKSETHGRVEKPRIVAKDEFPL